MNQNSSIYHVCKHLYQVIRTYNELKKEKHYISYIVEDELEWNQCIKYLMTLGYRFIHETSADYEYTIPVKQVLSVDEDYILYRDKYDHLIQKIEERKNEKGYLKINVKKWIQFRVLMRELKLKRVLNINIK